MSRLRPFVLAFLVAAAAGLPVASQEPPPIEGVIKGEGFTPIALAVPDPETTAETRDAAREILETLTDDLRFTGFFALVDPARHGLVPPPPKGQPLAFEGWMSVGANVVATLKVAPRGGRLSLEGRLFDLPSQTMVLGQLYVEDRDLVRRLGHRFADDIVQHFTGRPGVALSRIVFTSKHGKGKEIYLADYDGARVRRLTTTGSLNLSPVWSPDGERLAFVSWRGGSPAIWILDSDGNLAAAPAAGSELSSAPAWSPDGRKLAYAAAIDGNVEIFVLDLASRRNVRLTDRPSIETSPAFSPNGREIAFTSDRSGSPQVYIMDAEGLNVRRVSPEGNYNDSAAWSPQGDRLLYVSRIEGRFQIMLMDVGTGRVTQLTHGEGSNEDPNWSPDGRHIVFASNRAGTFDIYTMSQDGTSVRKLTTGGDCFTPDWSP